MGSSVIQQNKELNLDPRELNLNYNQL